MLSIVIPVRNPNPRILDTFIEKNKSYLALNNTIVIDSGGGEILEPHVAKYIKKDIGLWDARRLGYSFVSTEFVMNLDCDVIIPDYYIHDALELFRHNAKLGCVSIFYEDVTHNAGILEFGISIWRTDILKKLYDYGPQPSEMRQIIKVSDNVFTHVKYPFCECSYMWQKVGMAGYKIETLPVRAIHLSGKEIT